MPRLTAHARLRELAHQSFMAVVHDRVKQTNGHNTLNPVYSWVAKVLEPALAKEGFKYENTMTLTAPTWRVVLAEPGTEERITELLEGLGFRFKVQPATVVNPYKALAHNPIGGSGAPVTCVVKKWARGPVSVGLALPY